MANSIQPNLRYLFGPNGRSSTRTLANRRKGATEPTEANNSDQGTIWSVVFLPSGKYIASGSSEGRIRRWRVDDGKEVETQMNAGSAVCNIAVSHDGRWLVGGMENGCVAVWDTASDEPRVFRGHTGCVRAVDISPDGTKIATGSADKTACIWVLSTGERLLDPMRHDNMVVAAKFSPDGRFIATASSQGRATASLGDCVRVYNAYDTRLLAKVPIKVKSLSNQSLAWASDSKRLFVLSRDGYINRLSDPFTGEACRWPIHSSSDPTCIVLGGNDTFIAASANSTVSFWDITTHTQIGPVIKHEHSDLVLSMAVSTNYDIAIGGDEIIALSDLGKHFPSPYSGIISRDREILRMRAEKVDLEERIKSLRADLCARDDSNIKIACLEKTVRELHELADSQHEDDCLVHILRVHKQKYQCETLYNEGRVVDAAMCLLEITNMVTEMARAHKLMTDWLYKFTNRCMSTLMEDGDKALDVKKYDDAVKAYSTALSLSPSISNTDFQRRSREKVEKTGDYAMGSRNNNKASEHTSTLPLPNQVNRTTILLKRSKALALRNSWEEALGDACEVVKLDPSSYLGHERRHAALHGMRRYTEAFEAFKMMLSKIEQSSDPQISGLHCRYVDVTPKIQEMIEEAVRFMPHVLIHIRTGRLHNKAEQKTAFKNLSLYDELRSSMTTLSQLDYGRIQEEVDAFYRYVMFSHRWEDGEPLFQVVRPISINELKPSSPNTKLQKFCDCVRSLGFQWAWSDTCCIDRKNTDVLSESLVAMFSWYRSSFLTIVHLRDVSSQPRRSGTLRESDWNKRVWTYQEYVAAETIQFYTADWKPYLGLTMFNHKESPDIISEMQQVTGVSAQKLAALRPGRDRVREKLSMASVRQTTRVEDIAYSLLGIFKISMPVIYGEGYNAVGRLLERVLTGSGDVTILAWTGRAGDYNTCLPVDFTVYNKPDPPHVPLPIKKADMGRALTKLRCSLPDPSLAVALYDRLSQLPLPTLSSNRLRLPGFIFRLPELAKSSAPDPVSRLHIYRATTPAFGYIEIKTKAILAETKDLYLVHPWIHPLLDQEHLDGADALDKLTQALRLLIRLRQSFGALLFHRLARVDYERVATDCLIMVRVREDVSLVELISSIYTVNVH